jgi:hypothetical protein
LSIDNLIVDFSDLCFTLERVFFFEKVLKLMKHQLLDMMLNKPEFFIALVSQDFLEKGYIVILFLIGLHSLHYGCSPINN